LWPVILLSRLARFQDLLVFAVAVFVVIGMWVLKRGVLVLVLMSLFVP
jgi:hypothetical protein